MEEHLIEDAVKGNRHSLAKLLYENYETVFRYLIKFTLNKTLAEDLVQETMVRAIEKFELFDPGKAKFSTWLITIAQNIYLDGIRKRKREKFFQSETQGRFFCFILIGICPEAAQSPVPINTGL